MAGVWAVAATAVALIALLDTSGDDAKKTAQGATDRIESLESQQEKLTERVDALDTQVEDLAPAGDVSKLQNRLERAEKDAAAAEKEAKDASETVTDIEDRVSTLEDDAAAADDGAGTGGSNDPEQSP